MAGYYFGRPVIPLGGIDTWLTLWPSRMGKLQEPHLSVVSDSTYFFSGSRSDT